MCEHSKPSIPAGLGCLAEQLIFRVRQIDTDVIRRFAPLLPEQHFFREEWISLCVVFLFVGVPDIMQSSKRKGAGAVKQFDVIREAAQQGLPGELMLIFTAVIWCIFTLILLADLRNRLNNWCFISGMMFSIGALKEYLFYTLGPQLIQAGSWTAGFSEGLYSVLSAVFYYLSMPSVLVFSFFFHRWNRQMGRWFYLLCIAAYAPAVILAFVFPCTQTMHFQHDSVFCLTVAGYNWGLGIIATAILLHALWEERLSMRFRQRRLAAVTMLVPLWFWLVSAFPYHALGIPNLSKLWQYNLIIALGILIFFLYQAFREGIWGLRFRRESYDWTSDGKVIQRNAHFVGHALKNDLAKIEWCAALMRSRGCQDHELDIICGSVAHLKQFINRTKLYAQQITLTPEMCRIKPILEGAAAEAVIPAERHIVISVGKCDEEPLWCDRTHLHEVLTNLIGNAVDAMADGGQIELSYTCSRGKALISVTDTGCGMPPEVVKKMFDPYFTTKRSGNNMGLGLYYCWNVMSAHHGSITVKSTPDHGSTISLCFPVRRRKIREGGAQ